MRKPPYSTPQTFAPLREKKHPSKKTTSLLINTPFAEKTQTFA